jgi:hypothetical protein
MQVMLATYHFLPYFYHLEDCGIDGRIQKLISVKLGVCVDWIHLAQDRDQWQDLKNMLTNLKIP